MSLNDDIIPEYKQDIPETPARIILHYSAFKTSWDWLIIILTLYTTVSVPFIVCFNFNPLELAIIDMLVDWLFIADIVLNYHTTYVDKDGELVDDPKMIRMNYIRTWFGLDLISSLPYGILYFVNDKGADSLVSFGMAAPPVSVPWVLVAGYPVCPCPVYFDLNQYGGVGGPDDVG
ncbi:hypothetical protein QZH41_004762 [Actinostola sp. cb2023]|nr:hypothetical protein QZH41_004762 [Actinostola sp. cb2023]